jgi:hypothetical protein
MYEKKIKLYSEQIMMYIKYFYLYRGKNIYIYCKRNIYNRPYIQSNLKFELHSGQLAIRNSISKLSAKKLTGQDILHFSFRITVLTISAFFYDRQSFLELAGEYPLSYRELLLYTANVNLKKL